MSEPWPMRLVGPRICELAKSTLPAGLADPSGVYSFYCSSPDVRRIDRALTDIPAVLMGTGGIATVHYASGPYSYSTDTWAFTSRDGQTDIRFLYRQFERLLPRIDFLGFGGSGLRHLNKGFIRQMLLPIPLPEVQSKVVQVLDTLDTAIAQTGAIIAKLKVVKQGLLHDLLTRGIDANGELRPPQSEAPRLYKQTTLGWIPKEWEIKAGQTACAEIVVGIVIRPTQYYREEGVPVLRSANVRANKLVMTDLVFMSVKDHRSLTKSAVRRGDVLTVRTGYPGTTCVVDDQIEEANCVDILISRPGKGLISEFWSNWINSERGKTQVTAAQGGLAQQHFNVGDLQKLLIALPSIQEQKEVSTRVASIDSRLDLENRKLESMLAMKNGVMDDLLTGKVPVTALVE